MSILPGRFRCSAIRSFATLLCLFGGSMAPLAAQTIPAVWTSFDPSGFTATGTLGPLTVSATQVMSSAADTADLSGADYFAAPLGAAQGIVEYEEQSDFSVTFNRPVKGLMVYLAGWRPHTYTFSRPFKILSGLSGATVVGNNLTTPAGFTSGIVQLEETVTSVSVNNPTGSASRQGLTLAVVKERTAVGLNPINTRVRRPVLRLSGTASATFGVKRVLMKVGRKGWRPTRLSNLGESWRKVLRPKPGITRVKFQAIGFDGSKSPHREIRVGRKRNRIMVF